MPSPEFTPTPDGTGLRPKAQGPLPARARRSFTATATADEPIRAELDFTTQEIRLAALLTQSPTDTPVIEHFDDAPASVLAAVEELMGADPELCVLGWRGDATAFQVRVNIPTYSPVHDGLSGSRTYFEDFLTDADGSLHRAG